MTWLTGRLAAVLAATAVLLVVLVGWFAFISPERTKAAEVQGHVDETRATLDATQAYVNDPANRQTAAALRRLKTLLPDDVRMSQVLRQLAVASAGSGVRIDAITPGPAAVITGGEQTPIAVAVVGHYFNIGRFVQILNSRARMQGSSVVGPGRLYSVSGVTFNSGAAAPTGGPGANLSAGLSLNVYTYSPGAVPATTTPTDTTTSTTTTSTTTTASP
jgi:hypothetical protein